MLDAPLTPNKIYKALNKMPNNKSPGPDGLPAEFYKHFIMGHFISTIQKSNNRTKIPPYMNTASITLLLKPNKDST